MLYQSLKLTNGLCILVSYVSSPETPITHCHWSVELLKFPSTSIRSIEYFEKWCPFLNGLVQCPPATLWLAQAKNSFFLFKIVFLINLFCPISHASKVILKILQTRLQQYVNCELPDVHDAFRKVKGTRDQLASICWIMEKAREFQKKAFISALLTMPKPLTVWITINCGKFWKRWEYQTTWPAFWETYMQVRKQQLELDMEQQTGSK